MNNNLNATNKINVFNSNTYKTQNMLELFLLLIYKSLLEFVFIPAYLSIWKYMLGDISIQFNIFKSFISYTIAICLFLVYIYNGNHNTIYDFAFKMLLYLSIIPSIALYTVIDRINYKQLLYPMIYFFVLTILINRSSESQKKCSIIFKRIPFLDLIILTIAFIFSIMLWVFLDFPITLSLSDTYDQRMTMRTIELPSIINYIYLMLGNVVIPYFFAKSLMYRKKMRAVISLVTGLLLFFSNGMKTWLLLYIIGIGLFVFYRLFKDNYKKIIIALEIFFCTIVILSFIALIAVKNNVLLGQLGRVLIIPSRIGYTSIDFFSKSEHEFLYLRESILKLFFESPYPGGSDFYMNYGTNTTLTSARANNGLWGDAFRNFGFVGMFIYPFLLMYIFNVVIRSMDKQRDSVKQFVLLLLIWSSINTSFFTWLITGGIILLIIILKIENVMENENT